MTRIICKLDVIQNESIESIRRPTKKIADTFISCWNKKLTFSTNRYHNVTFSTTFHNIRSRENSIRGLDVSKNSKEGY